MPVSAPPIVEPRSSTDRIEPVAAEEGLDGRVDRLHPSARSEEDFVLLPDEPHPFSEEDADVFRALPIKPRTIRMSGKDLCWYGAWTVDGLPRLRALIADHRATL